MELLTSLFSSAWSIFLVALFFGGSIFVHELGHFLVARRRGVHVERFSIGFGPAIWSRRGKDGVEYRLSWFPLGGYVLLPQLADLGPIEGASTADVTKLPPISYTTKMLVFGAGAAFNVLFAFLLACVLWAVGVTVAEEEQTTRLGIVRQTIEVRPGTTVPGPAYTAGMRDKDVIVSVDGKAVHSFEEISQLIALGGGRDDRNHPQVTIDYLRDGEKKTAIVQPELVGSEKMRDIGVEPAVKVTLGAVTAGMAADEAGAKVGDVLLRLDGKPVDYAGYVQDYLRKSEGQPLSLELLRDNQPLTLLVQPRKVLDPETKVEMYRLGVQLRGAFTAKTLHVAPWTQVQQQMLFTWRNLMSLLNPHTDVGLSKMAGPVGIVRIFHSAAEAGLRAVLWFTILININLAIFNLLPIPVLDGGQMVFATVARLRGRALPLNFVMATQGVFMALLLSMVAYVTVFGDLRRLIREKRVEHAETAAAPAAAQQPKK